VVYLCRAALFWISVFVPAEAGKISGAISLLHLFGAHDRCGDMEMKDKKQFQTTMAFSLMLAMGLVLRFLFLPVKTLDTNLYNMNWYDYIVAHGIINAMGDEFANYTPPYLYLLSLATLTKSFLPKLIAIKLIPIAFDVINSILIYQIVKTQFKKGSKPVLAAMIFWVLPTVIINGAFWGQADALYTCFLLLCVLFLLRDRSILAMIAFAIAFSIKAQAIFILPFLAILFFKKRIPWQSFFLIPVAYFIMMLPALLAGRSFLSLVLAYVTQGNTYFSASMNAPNLYFFVPQNAYQASLIIGFPLAGLGLLTWALFFGRRNILLTPKILLITALVSVALTPFLLPKMHDRYFYPSDVFSLVAAFFIPEIWFVPIAYQVVSLLSYGPYLFGSHLQGGIPFAVLLNALIIIFLLYKQKKMVAAE
jgi:Gpi18-like mannosyltransferase